ncbi:MAG: primosomal protein N' [Candidatus Methylacidiphilales bacterium]
MRAAAAMVSEASPGFARVIPELTLDKTFDYAIPVAWMGRLQPGHRVRVPFGPRKILAYVVDLVEQPEVAVCKEIEAVTEEEPLLPASLLELARWMAEYYCSDLPTVLRAMLPEPVRSKPDGHLERLWVQVASGLNEAEVAERLKRARSQWRAWQAVQARGGGWLADLVRESGVGPAAWKGLAEKGLVHLGRQRRERIPFRGEVVNDSAIGLNPDQAKALEVIVESLNLAGSPRPILLQGVTGSGKTEVYLQALAKCLEMGRSGIVLVPEIALTPQTIGRFRERFEASGVGMAVLHSRLSAGERHDQWHRVRTGRARVVIGARSAVFAPVRDLGLVVVDEEHEASYKQEETPFYHARDVAVLRASKEGAVVVLGSATPSLESVWNARQDKYRLVRLPKRIDGAEMPVIHIVDLRKERKKMPGSFWLTRRLCQAVIDRAQKGEQSLLYLNRRGFATSVQCENCGHVEMCPHCSVPLTYHKASGRLRCHLCDYVNPLARVCPKCSFDQRGLVGAGTQRIEEVVAQALPGLRWRRVDSDSMGGRDALETTLADFAAGKLDLLIGTQMIAKGLHLPGVTCVGIISVDAALNLPDFRASERVFQQIVQVAGRAGRGGVAGEVFIQTHTPFHPAISFGRHHDVDGFLDQELEYRREFNYPPFRRLVLLTFRGPGETKTEWCAAQAAKALAAAVPEGVEVGEVAPAPVAKWKDAYRFQILIKTGSVREVLPHLRRQVAGVTWPDGVVATLNVDPVALM